VQGRSAPTRHLVAVVDDEEPVRRSMERLLRSAGYEVALFAEGATFLDSLGRARPACVLVDGNMPGMDGREVLRRLAAEPARVPVIVVSGHDSPDNRRAAAELGALAFFTKPFDPDALLRALAAAVSPA
jgi:two-component system response regulator FixJ